MKWPTELLRAFVILFMLTLVTGLAYPLLILGVGHTFFPHRVEGSLIYGPAHQPMGSILIGQNFTKNADFWGRPSATTPADNPLASTGSNLGPLNPAWVALVKARVQSLEAADPAEKGPIPVDLLTASGSGLDPDISPAAALYQAPRVAAARHLPLKEVTQLIARETSARQFGLLGEERVNVVQLNNALNALSS